MPIKAILYLIITPLIVYVVESLNIDKFFKKNRRTQIVIFYLILAVTLSYLVVNFLLDFFVSTKTFY